MKALSKSKFILFIILIAGVAGMLLRTVLYSAGIDDRGLMDNDHPLHIACLVLSAAVVIYTALSVRKLDGSNAYEDNFPASKHTILSLILLPLWFLAGALTIRDMAFDAIGKVWTALAFASVPCLAYTGYCLVKGRKPLFVFHGIVCVFFVIDLICRSRIWIANPQLPDYTFHLFACVFLTLTAYYRTAFDVGMGSRRPFLFCSLMAIFFCMLSSVGSDSFLFCIGGALWAVSNLYPLEPVRREPEPEIREES